jgi:hypothetical protein
MTMVRGEKIDIRVVASVSVLLMLMAFGILGVVMLGVEWGDGVIPSRRLKQTPQSVQSWQSQTNQSCASRTVTRSQIEAQGGQAAVSPAIKVAICTSVKLSQPDDLEEWVQYYKRVSALSHALLVLLPLSSLCDLDACL